MSAIVKFDPTARIPEAAGGAQRRVYANNTRALGSTRVLWTNHEGGLGKLARSLGMMADATANAGGALRSHLDDKYEEGLVKGEMMHAAGISRNEADGIGESVGWDRAAGMTKGIELAQQLSSMSAEGSNDAERKAWLENKLKGIGGADKHVLKAMLPYVRSGIKQSARIETARNTRMAKEARDQTIKDSFRAAAQAFIDDPETYDVVSKDAYENAIAAGLSKGKAKKMQLASVFEQIEIKALDGETEAAEELLDRVMDTRKNGAPSVWSDPDMQLAVSRQVASLRGKLDRVDAINESERRKDERDTLESYGLEIARDVKQIDDKNKLYEMLEQVAEETGRDAFEQDMLNIKSNQIVARLKFLEAKDGRMDGQRSEEATKMISDILLKKRDVPDSELQLYLEDGSLSAQQYLSIKQVQRSKGTPVVSEGAALVMEALKPYTTAPSGWTVGKNKKSGQEPYFNADGRIHYFYEGQEKAILKDISEEFLDWFDNEPRDMDSAAGRIAIKDKFDEIAKKSLERYKIGYPPEGTTLSAREPLPDMKEWESLPKVHQDKIKKMLYDDGLRVAKNKRAEWLNGLPESYRGSLSSQLEAHDKSEERRLAEVRVMQEKKRQQQQRLSSTTTNQRHNDFMLENHKHTDRIYRYNKGKLELIEVPWSVQRVGEAWSESSAPKKVAQWATEQGAGIANMVMDVVGARNSVESDKWVEWAREIGWHEEKRYHGGKKITGEGKVLAHGEDALWTLLREEMKAKHDGKPSVVSNPDHDPYFSGDRFKTPYSGHYQYNRVTGISEFLNGDPKALPEGMRKLATRILNEMQQEGFAVKDKNGRWLYNPEYSPEMLVESAAMSFERNRKK